MASAQVLISAAFYRQVDGGVPVNTVPVSRLSVFTLTSWNFTKDLSKRGFLSSVKKENA